MWGAQIRMRPSAWTLGLDHDTNDSTDPNFVFLPRWKIAEILDLTENEVGELLYMGWFRWEPTSSVTSTLRPRYDINLFDTLEFDRKRKNNEVLPGARGPFYDERPPRPKSQKSQDF